MNINDINDTLEIETDNNFSIKIPKRKIRHLRFILIKIVVYKIVK